MPLEISESELQRLKFSLNQTPHTKFGVWVWFKAQGSLSNGFIWTKIRWFIKKTIIKRLYRNDERASSVAKWIAAIHYRVSVRSERQMIYWRECSTTSSKVQIDMHSNYQKFWDKIIIFLDASVLSQVERTTEGAEEFAAPEQFVQFVRCKTQRPNCATQPATFVVVLHRCWWFCWWNQQERDDRLRFAATLKWRVSALWIVIKKHKCKFFYFRRKQRNFPN